MTGAQRSALLPEVPTVAESGVPGYEAASWIGMLAPAATQQPIVEKFREATHAAMQAAAVRDILLRDGSDVDEEDLANPLPATLGEALEELNWDPVVREALGQAAPGCTRSKSPRYPSGALPGEVPERLNGRDWKSRNGG